MTYDDFMDKAEDFGFDEDQANFLWDHMARIGHHHSIEQVDGLEEELDSCGAD